MGIKRVTMEDKELKERFFALYYGQWIARFDDNGEELKYATHRVSHVLGTGIVALDEKAYLELKPPFSISDDLKKELFEKVNGIASALLGRNLTTDIDYLLENAEIGFVNSFVVDFLRCHGFAIQWMGISVEQQVEKGWIKLVE